MFISEENNSVITIVNQPRTAQSKTRIRRMSSTMVSKDALQIKLKARSKEEALEWLKAIQSRRENVHDEDDLKMMMAEKLMDGDQQQVFGNDVDKLKGLITFEGMLENRFLRQNFQKYLKKSSSDEFLKFWEYAEDFRCGHPRSPTPFTFEGNSDSAEKTEISSRYVKHWAKQIFDAFLKDGARHQISDCSSEDRTKIFQGLEVDEPAYNLFAVVQSLTFQSLKFTWYPQFTRLHVYPALLKSALKAVESDDRSDLLFKFLGVSHGNTRSAKSIEGSSSLKPSSGDTKLTPSPTAAAASTSGGFFGFFRRTEIALSQSVPKSSPVTSRKGSNSGSRLKADNSLSSSLQMCRCLPTPWRRGAAASSSFDAWIPDEWWDFMIQDTGGLQGWRQSYSNPEFENSLIKMMPTWMPVKQESIDAVFRDVINCDARKSVESMREAINMIMHMHSLADSRISQENADALLLKYKEAFMGSELSEKMRSGDVEKCKSALISMPTVSFARSSQYISSQLTCNIPWGGTIVFYCCMICNSFNGRNVPGKGESNPRYR